nr:hypothetical protein [uncultured Holophaga sp.]
MVETEKLNGAVRLALVEAATKIAVAAIGTRSTAIDSKTVYNLFHTAYNAVHAAYLGKDSEPEAK